MPFQLNTNQFISDSYLSKNIIDVRSPGEYLQGHIPGAVNIPLFDNEERTIIGTLYKRKGKQDAILKGLEIVGPKMAAIAVSAQNVSSNNTVFVHCWRGGMRSGSIAWLLEMYGLKVYLLKGGYKAFRKEVLKSFSNPYPLVLLGGKTGSGKTLVLSKLKEIGQQVIDLESLANHKGSAFGALGEPEAPSQEQFENLLYHSFFALDTSKTVWLEDEGRLIGKKVVPEGLWLQMRNASIFHINLPFEERVQYLVREYGKYPKDLLKESIIKIGKRLGPEQTKLSIEALEQNDLRTTCEYCLNYYDKTYAHGLSKREKPSIYEVFFEQIEPMIIAKTLSEKLNELKHNGRI